MDDCILKIEKLEKSFGELKVLKSIDLEIHKGEVVCIVGVSGSGKSTLLRCINLMEEADAGNIWFDGQNLMDLNVNLNALRQKIGMVFQSFNLFNNKNVIDNCTLAPMTVKKMNKAQAQEIAVRHLKQVGILSMRIPPACPVGRSSAWQLQERCVWNRKSCSLMSRPLRWIQRSSGKCWML